MGWKLYIMTDQRRSSAQRSTRLRMPKVTIVHRPCWLIAPQLPKHYYPSLLLAGNLINLGLSLYLRTL